MVSGELGSTRKTPGRSRRLEADELRTIDVTQNEILIVSRRERF